MSFYARLERDTEQARQHFLGAPIIQDVMAGNFTLGTYIAFLNQAYHHVCHTVPLLMQAGARLSGSQRWMQKAIADYIIEEQGHEQWILDDIEACGRDRRRFEQAPAPFDSELLVSYLYDVVNRQNPVGIFGMVLVLEGTSSSLAPEVARIVQDALNLPDAAMTYLTSHGELDQTHMERFRQLMDAVADEADQQAIIHVANNVYRLYGNVYRAIHDEAGKLEQGKAA